MSVHVAVVVEIQLGDEPWHLEQADDHLQDQLFVLVADLGVGLRTDHLNQAAEKQLNLVLEVLALGHYQQVAGSRDFNL